MISAQSVQVDFTVAICTYNGEDRLPQLLDCLRSQSISSKEAQGASPEASQGPTSDLTWEVLVVDNNSTDRTQQIVQDYQTRWPAACLLRYCFEAQQGLAFARRCAVEAARGQFIGFLDDDNLPDSEWVATAYRFGQAHPQAGAYGSRIHGEFEASPPANFRRIAALLALTERGSEAHRYEPGRKVLPPGAGLVVRKQAWIETVPSSSVLLGRIGNSMIAGEDLEALLHIQQAGWEVWYNPEMRICHRIPYWRLEKDYLIRLGRGIGLSRYQTRMLSVKPWQRPLACLAYAINDLRKIAIHLIKYRTATYSDPVAACEMELFVSSLISPCYMWQRQLIQWFNQRTKEQTRGTPSCRCPEQEQVNGEEQN